MMLLTNAKEPKTRFIRRRILNSLPGIGVLLAGIVMVMGLVYMISSFETGRHGRVYAVDSSVNEGAPRVQTGLSGVVNGVADMERYADAARLMSVEGAKEEMLAGASGIDRKAVRQMQIGRGIARAGELGYYAAEAVQSNQMSQEEYRTLLQIVEAEATGGDITSKMIVAGVVLNRVRDSHFPDTIYDVVWEKEQFQPTSDGRIHTCTVTESTIEAVEKVLAGEDLTQGALFFFARDSAEQRNAAWFDSSLAKLFEYGGHEYYTYQEYVAS